MRKNGKLFRSLIRNYTILLLVLTVCIGVTFTSLNMVNLREKQQLTMSFLLRRQVQNFETRVKTASVLFDSMIYGENVKRYIDLMTGRLPEGSYGQVMLELVEELQKTQAIWLAIDTVPAITTAGSGVMVTAEGTMSNAEFAKKYRLTHISQLEVAECLKPANSEYGLVTRTHITKSENGDVVLINGIIRDKNVVYTVEIFPWEKMNIGKQDISNFFVIGSNELLFAEEEVPGQYFVGFLDAALENADDSGFLRWKGSRFCTMRSSVLPNVQFAYRLDAMAFVKDSYLIVIECIVLMLILGFFGIWFILRKTNKVYAPIENVVEVLKDYNDTDAIDELTFIRNAATNIISDNISYQQEIVKSRSAMKNQFLIDWVYGLLSEDDIIEKIAEFDLLSLKNGCRVVIIEQTERDYHRLLDARDKLLQALALEVGETYLGEVFEKELGMIVVLLPMTDEVEAREAMNALVCEISNTFELEFAISIGSYERNLHELRKSFENALVLKEMRNTGHSRNLLTMKEFDKPESQYIYPLEIERSLISAAVGGEREHAEKIFENIIQRNLREQDINAYSLLEFEMLLLSTMRRILQLVNIPEHKVFDEDALFPESINSAPELVAEKLKLKFQKVMDVVCGTENGMNVKLASILKYVENNYQKDIGRGDIVREFHISESYVGKLFSNELGINFKSYLNRLRISKAKEIIRSHAGIKMSEIPGMVGYNNSVSFLRLFKKYEGMSPTEYQKKWQERNHEKRGAMEDEKMD